MIRPAAFATLAAYALLASTQSLLAQPRSNDDSTRAYRLGEVTVRADSMRTIAPATVQRVPYARIARTDALTAAGLAYQIPSARVQTNSRGESLVYMRAAAERQVALYFDGALMNIPWDNRLDMSMLPAGAIGGITVSKGAPSVLYGANTMGGTINMVSLNPPRTGTSTEVQAQAGGNGVLGGALLHAGRTGSLSYVGEIGYSSRASQSLPRDASLTHHQQPGSARTNSDLRSFNVYVRGEKHISERAEIGAAVLFADATKGVPPEGHVEDARFWRYPTWRTLTVAVNSEAVFGGKDALSFRGTGWATSFAQDIEQYTDARYALRTALEEDRDLTFGTRLLLRHELGTGGVSIALNGLSSTHSQRELEYDSTGAVIELRDSAGIVIPQMTDVYQQHTYSIGVEAEQRFGDLGVTLGASVDGMLTPKTADKPSQDAFSAYGLVVGLLYDVDASIALRASGGRKSRFPTMRELYGEALRRFLINPSLEPEHSWVGELGAEVRGDWGSLAIAGFHYSTSNTIDQRTVDTLGGRRRQRINLPGSTATGFELTGALRSLSPFRVDGHFTYVRARGRGAEGTGSTFPLTEKPDIIASLTAEYAFDIGLLPSFEIVHTGLAYGQAEDNALVELPPSTAINARLALRFSPWQNAIAHIFARVNNLADALIQPQLGLPSPGREIIGGVKLSL